MIKEAFIISLVTLLYSQQLVFGAEVNSGQVKVSVGAGKNLCFHNQKGIFEYCDVSNLNQIQGGIDLVDGTTMCAAILAEVLGGILLGGTLYCRNVWGLNGGDKAAAASKNYEMCTIVSLGVIVNCIATGVSLLSIAAAEAWIEGSVAKI